MRRYDFIDQAWSSLATSEAIRNIHRIYPRTVGAGYA